MSKKVIAKLENLTHQEWLELRRTGIGGSDCAAALGMSKWQSQLGLWLDKMGQGKPVEESEAMYWGKVMEPVLLAEFSKRTGKDAQPCPLMFQSVEYPFMLADLDGIVKEEDGSTSIVEIKTANSFAVNDWSDGVPVQYYLQVQHYMATVDLTKTYLCVLLGGNEFQIHEIDRDEDTIKNIIALEHDFWQKVVTKTQPEVDSQSGDALNTMYPEANNTSVMLDDTADSIIDDYVHLKAIEDDLKAKKAELENKLKNMLGQAELGKSKAGFTVKWANSTSKRLDTTALKKDVPELVAKYTKESSSRRFSVVAPK
ncbi:MAG: YqaJ viral recombinase family protein [Anaerovibrio sp.]|nr:YqaJ viral recombinase family protein [Anaerovibrio sp.]